MGILNTITKALGLDNTKKTPKEPTRIPKTVQDSIPYLGAYENGIIQVSARGYSRMYALSDINFSIESMDEQRAIFGKYSEFIGSFGPEVQMQVVVHNKSISSSEFEQNVLIGMKNDSLNEYREEMNNMLIDKMAVARNNIIHNKYLVVYIEADDIEAAKNTFSRLDSSIASGLKKLIGTDVAPCSIRERLSNLYDIYHVDSDIPFYQKLKMRDGRISETFNLKELKKRGLTTKDAIAPMSMVFEHDYIRIDDKYARSLTLRNLPSYLRGDILAEMSNQPFNMLTSIIYRSLAQGDALFGKVRGLCASDEASVGGDKAGVSALDLDDTDAAAGGTGALLDDVAVVDQGVETGISAERVLSARDVVGDGCGYADHGDAEGRV